MAKSKKGEKSVNDHKQTNIGNPGPRPNSEQPGLAAAEMASLKNREKSKFKKVNNVLATEQGSQYLERAATLIPTLELKAGNYEPRGKNPVRVRRPASSVSKGGGGSIGTSIEQNASKRRSSIWFQNERDHSVYGTAHDASQKTTPEIDLGFEEEKRHGAELYDSDRSSSSIFGTSLPLTSSDLDIEWSTSNPLRNATDGQDKTVLDASDRVFIQEPESSVEMQFTSNPLRAMLNTNTKIPKIKEDLMPQSFSRDARLLVAFKESLTSMVHEFCMKGSLERNKRPPAMFAVAQFLAIEGHERILRNQEHAAMEVLADPI